MEPSPQFWAGRKVCVTGGTGFLGRHLAGQLRHLGASVRLFGLSPAHDSLRGFDYHRGDIRDADAVAAALRDQAIVFHTAGNVAVWGPGLAVMHDIHVRGTANVLAGMEPDARLVHTSSVVAVGASHSTQPLTEDSSFDLQRMKIDYVHAKRHAEEIALEAAADKDVVVVNPGYLVGPEDYARSVMGRLCMRVWKRRVPLLLPGGLNFADVRDVARGHLLAAEHGRSGRRYILGGENLSMADFVRQVAQVGGLWSRWWPRMPVWLMGCLAVGAEVRGWWLGKEPYPGMQQVRLSRRNWFYSSRRAGDELGYSCRPLDATLRDTHAWFTARGLLHRGTAVLRSAV